MIGRISHPTGYDEALRDDLSPSERPSRVSGPPDRAANGPIGGWR